MSAASTPRVVPGALPPASLSKSQLKRKKKSKKTEDGEDAPSPVVVADSQAAATIEQAPAAEDIAAGTVATELVAQPQTTPATPITDTLELDGGIKLSPIVDLVNKRLKVTNKKIVRATLLFMDIVLTTADAYNPIHNRRARKAQRGPEAQHHHTSYARGCRQRAV